MSKNIFLVIALILTVSSAGFCKLYMYKDSRGKIYLTNVLKTNLISRFKENYKDYKLVYGSAEDFEEYKTREKEFIELDAKAKDEYKYDRLIRNASVKYKIPFELIKAVIAVESDFDANAVSEKGAIGLMQLMPATAKEMRIKNITDPEQNIYGGTKYLRQLMDRFDNDIELVLASYNAGPTLVEKTYTITGDIPRIKDLRLYIRNVLELRSSYMQENDIKNSIKIKYRNGKIFLYNN